VLACECDRSFFAGNNLKPYQGLKQLAAWGLIGFANAGNNLKPYQGLKRHSHN